MSQNNQHSSSLLKHLRNLAASPLYGKERLDMIVRLIADSVQADVCSIYILRRDNLLELYATEGLSREAIHRTTLKVGEGIIGWSAADKQSIAIADAPKHERFAYKPETNEDAFHSMLCIPLLKNLKTVGVLALQNTMRRIYTEAEIEMMETVGMVVTEMLNGAAQLADLNASTEPQIFTGISLYEGLVIGNIYLHEPYVRITNFIADDIEVEHKRLHQAAEVLRFEVDNLISSAVSGLKSDTKEILETYRIFSRDKGWFTRISAAIEQGLTAEAAVDRVRSDIVNTMQSMKDSYLRERYHDFNDLANRILRLLSGKPLHKSEDLPENAIVIAKSMGPAELLEYNISSIKGLIIEEASQTSHVSILARSLAIPSVGRCRGIYRVAQNYYPILLDANIGKVRIFPDKATIENFSKAIQNNNLQLCHQNLQEPCISKDNVDIELFVNAGLSYDINLIKQKQPMGIGLFRSELQLLLSAGQVSFLEQTDFYRQTYDALDNKPIYFRTYDIGGDKIPSYLSSIIKEDNPALGFRGIRIGLERPVILRIQMRSFLLAANGRPLNVIFPMITSLDEFLMAKEICLKEVNRFKKLGLRVSQEIRFGIMVEVPIVAMHIDDYLDDCDFLSVGGNDLLQFCYAADRDNPKTASRYDRLSSASLKLLRYILVKANQKSVPIRFCGEMAGNIIEIAALIGIGYRSFSISVAQIEVIHQAIKRINVADIGNLIEKDLDKKNVNIRENIRYYISGVK